MIKVGDRFSLNNENWEVIFINNDSVAVARSENGEGRVVSQRTIYKNWYEQQKQRADRAEKRWSELKNFLLRYENVPESVQSFENVFEYMKEVERIEEDGE
ncbi:hypothetical protein BFS35_012205 [Macrococcoides goetzii]|uniref:Uncharacterized protein n=1 Tax=Macrococcoides goetzii TaxID=1891097 RepID=A0A2G5NWJ1_9STAP|nr:hypothetical protein [Macrococcus goetzii]RAI79315.1 hypothetical protein BFS35_012205 [Macrococcus goetzii]